MPLESQCGVLQAAGLGDSPKSLDPATGSLSTVRWTAREARHQTRSRARSPGSGFRPSQCARGGGPLLAGRDGRRDVRHRVVAIACRNVCDESRGEQPDGDDNPGLRADRGDALLRRASHRRGARAHLEGRRLRRRRDRRPRHEDGGEPEHRPAPAGARPRAPLAPQPAGRERTRPLRADALVFQTRSGSSPGRRNVLRAVQRAADKAGLNTGAAEPIGLHDLRHSTAGLAFESLALNEVSRLLRHANPRVTTTVYGGISDDAAASIGAKLADGGFGT